MRNGNVQYVKTMVMVMVMVMMMMMMMTITIIYLQAGSSVELCALQSRIMIITIQIRRQCGRVVRALALRFGDPGFKTRSDHSLNLFLVFPGSTSQLHL